MRGNSDDVRITLGSHDLHGDWTVPFDVHGVVIFAHGSGSSRKSSRNRFVARVLQEAGFATLLMDLLDEEEANDRSKVFDINLLANRVEQAIDWVAQQSSVKDLPLGLFGASTGAAAALEAAARKPDRVTAVVSRGGRPDLAWPFLPAVKAPTLLIVGERDHEVLVLNRKALRQLGGYRELRIVPDATHLFEEPGTLEHAAEQARQWFLKHLAGIGNGNGNGKEPPMFANRADVAWRLAARFKGRKLTDPIVLAIPRGGVVLGAVLAEALPADLDVALARKLRMPGNPEFALGAISESGDVHLNVAVEELSPALQEYLEREAQTQMDEIARRREFFRHGRPAKPLEGRSVIVVDDGIATGSTMIAALHAVRLHHPREIIVATPVAAPDRLRKVEAECDEAICLIEAPDLIAVGQFYLDFTQVRDDEVIALLNQFAREEASSEP